MLFDKGFSRELQGPCLWNTAPRSRGGGVRSYPSWRIDAAWAPTENEGYQRTLADFFALLL